MVELARGTIGPSSPSRLATLWTNPWGGVPQLVDWVTGLPQILNAWDCSPNLGTLSRTLHSSGHTPREGNSRSSAVGGLYEWGIRAPARNPADFSESPFTRSWSGNLLDWIGYLAIRGTGLQRPSRRHFAAIFASALALCRALGNSVDHEARRGVRVCATCCRSRGRVRKREWQ